MFCNVVLQHLKNLETIRNPHIVFICLFIELLNPTKDVEIVQCSMLKKRLSGCSKSLLSPQGVGGHSPSPHRPGGRGRVDLCQCYFQPWPKKKLGTRTISISYYITQKTIKQNWGEQNIGLKDCTKIYIYQYFTNIFDFTFCKETERQLASRGSPCIHQTDRGSASGPKRGQAPAWNQVVKAFFGWFSNLNMQNLKITR